MQFEHFALNVPDSKAMADWYVKHCGMSVVRSVAGEPYTRFLADETGRVVMEIYTNPAAPMPDYAAQDPLVFHFAFALPDAVAKRDELVAAGAMVLQEPPLGASNVLIMLRDPWGIALQLCQRSKSLV